MLKECLLLNIHMPSDVWVCKLILMSAVGPVTAFFLDHSSLLCTARGCCGNTMASMVHVHSQIPSHWVKDWFSYGFSNFVVFSQHFSTSLLLVLPQKYAFPMARPLFSSVFTCWWVCSVSILPFLTIFAEIHKIHSSPCHRPKSSSIFQWISNAIRGLIYEMIPVLCQRKTFWAGDGCTVRHGV